MTFEVDGRQYLAVGAGGRIAQTTTFGRLVGVDVPQGTGVMWVFALPDGELEPIPRPRRADVPMRSVLDGVYAAAQAEEGERLWAQECADCHEAVNYTGENFTAKWVGGTLSDVYQDLSLSMPPASPGALTPVTYASIVAYLMSESGYPAGDGVLPGDPFQLRGITIPSQGESRQSGP